MAISSLFSYAKSLLVFSLAFISHAQEVHSHTGVGGHRGLSDTPDTSATKIFDITKYGAIGDGKTDSAKVFTNVWNEACKKNADPAKVLVPKGTFLTSPVVFQGPCKSSKSIIVEVQGTVSATTNLSQYEDYWFLFEKINGVTLTGGGIFDGQGPKIWKCKENNDCTRLPSSIKFQSVTNAVISEITSVNSKFFHYHITECNDFTAKNLKIIAPDESPNTDGIHISSTNRVTVTKSTIRTGDDCISIGDGVTDGTFSEIFCGPGHGISIGSLGKYENEDDVNRILVTNCTLSNTQNGVRIKTWGGSPPSKASGITFEDIIMKNVKNPIIIDQNYGDISKPSQVKVSDIQYKKIRGTSVSKVAVSLLCSPSVPCEGIELSDIDLIYADAKQPKSSSVSASCENAEVTIAAANLQGCAN